MSSFASPARRGLSVQHYLPLIPPAVVQEARDHQDDLARRRGTRTFLHDLEALLERPGPSQWAARQSDVDGARAALASLFCRLLCDQPDRLLPSYLCQVLPEIQEIVRSAAGTIRLIHDPEFRQVLAQPASTPLVLSTLAPLAMFFFRTLGAGRYDWETLVPPGQAPPHRPAFGFLPSTDSLRWTLRFLVIGQCGQAFRPNALLYSPLARYLIDQGLAQRVHVLKRSCPACDYWGDAPACPNCGCQLQSVTRPWLLATAYIQQCTFLEMPDRQHVVLMDDQPVFAQAGRAGGREGPRAESPAPDARALASSDRPGAQFERREMKRLALRAVRRLLDKLLDEGKPRLKALILWAEAANLDDPSVLLNGQADEGLADALIEAMVAPEVTHRAERLPRMNQHLLHLASRFNLDDSQPFTGNQMGANLVRLRRQFMSILEGLVRTDYWA